MLHLPLHAVRGGLVGLPFILWLLAGQIIKEAEQRPRHLLGHCLSLLLQRFVELGFVRGDIGLFFLVLTLCLSALLFKVCWRDGRVGGLESNQLGV